MPSLDRAELARRIEGPIRRSALALSSSVRRHAALLLVNLAVAAIVVALPFIGTARATSASASSTALGATSLSSSDGSIEASDAGLALRAQPQPRGGTITAGRNPVTVQAQGVRPITEYTLSPDDSLWSLANFFGVSPEAIAFANGISDPWHLQVGRQIMIPPLEGALYTVAAGDTVESVAARFKVDPEVIRTYNRLYFEPEHFAPGQLIFVQDAALPRLPEEVPGASVIARVAAPSSARGGGTLAWPVRGYITQYFWYGHTGVDIAAPYGSGLAASVDGVISQTGWVAVGGLHLCVTAGNLEECYYHLSAAYLPVGAPVRAGQIVAAIGLTGVTTGPHVHWETRVNGQLVNPLTIVP